MGQVTHVLLTRLPLMYSYKYVYSSLDLHALGAPLAFILSHDQTLRFLTVLANFRVLTLDSSRSCSASYHYSTVKVLPMTRISFCEMRTPMRALHRHCNLMPFLAPVLPAIVFLCTLKYSILRFLVKYALPGSPGFPRWLLRSFTPALFLLFCALFLRTISDSTTYYFFVKVRIKCEEERDSLTGDFEYTCGLHP